MLSRIAIFFLGALGLLSVGSSAWALQAGGVEVGDLETGSVVGQRFKELEVDVQLFAVDLGPVKSWYPPTTVIDFKVRPGRPLLLTVTNMSSSDRGFQMTERSPTTTTSIPNNRAES